MSDSIERQPLANVIADALAELGPEEAERQLCAVLDELTNVQLAALAYDWENVWARPVQRFPTDDEWSSHGYLTSRRFGKTRANAEFVNAEAESKRAMRIGFCAQNYDKTLEVMVHGDSGLIATAKPWFKPEFVGEKGIPARVVWPNGAQAFPFTPEKPGNIRGPGTHLFWASELQSWPAKQREEAFFGGIMPMNSLGYGRLIWDATPKKRHPLISKLLKRAAAEPRTHIVRGGTIRENQDNLSVAAVNEMYKAIGGTQRGREELEGEFSDADDEALWSQEWIDHHRRSMPTELKRRVIAIDPAISDRKGTDRTGFSEVGLGHDDQALVIADHSDTFKWAAWGELAVKLYAKHHCDCIVVERNRGGDACAHNIVVAAKARGWRVEIVKSEATTRYVSGVIYVKEVTSRLSKAARFENVASLAQCGRLSHVEGADLEALEDAQTTWVPEPGADSPDALDAMCLGVDEVVDFDAAPDLAEGFKGASLASRAIQAAAAAPVTDVAGSSSSGLVTLAQSLKSPWGGGL